MAHVNPRTAGVRGSFPINDRKAITSAVSSISFDNLKGNSATIYKIDGYLKCESVEAGVLMPHLSINGDTSGTNGVDGNYRDLIVALDTSYTATVAADQNEFSFAGGTLTVGQYIMFTIEAFARSGQGGHVIKAEASNMDSGTGKTKLVTGSWDVGDEITSIEIYAGGGASFDEATFTGEAQLSYMGG